MIEFHAPTLADRDWIVRRAAESGERGSEYSFANLLLWAPAFHQEVAHWNGLLLVRVSAGEGSGCFWPAGGGDCAAALEAMETDAAERGEPFRLICLAQEHRERLEELCPGQFVFTPHRDSWDYLYDIDKLADLAGRKLHSKRNHCKRFEDAVPGWSFSPMTGADLPECLALDREWDRRSREREGKEEAEDLTLERRALLTAAEHFEALGMEGGVLRDGEGKLLAFTMGDPISEKVFDVHFEKALDDIQGAYAVVNREFARLIREKHPQVRLLNREEDMGIEGLRKAKESYYPDEMTEKHWAIRKESD